MSNNNLFKRVLPFDKSALNGKKVYCDLKSTSLPMGTMTEKISALAARNLMKAYVDGDKELIYLSQKIKTDKTLVCVVDFKGSIVENGSVRGQTSHGNMQYKSFSTTTMAFKDVRKSINALLGDSFLVKIALSGDTELLTKILKNQSSIDVLQFTQELKAFSEAQNDWDVRAIANNACALAYEIIEAQGRSGAECTEK